MSDTDPRCCCRSHGQRLCPLHQPLSLWILLLGLALACGGRVDNGMIPELGWCCGDHGSMVCGLWASEAEVFQSCECTGGFVRPVPGTLGECMPRVD